jgi:hypothetical protein
LRYAFLISSCEAPFFTPRVSYSELMPAPTAGSAP